MTRTGLCLMNEVARGEGVQAIVYFMYFKMLTISSHYYVLVCVIIIALMYFSG